MKRSNCMPPRLLWTAWVIGLLTVFAGCAAWFSDYKTMTYQVQPPSWMESRPEEIEKAFAAEYGKYVLERLPVGRSEKDEKSGAEVQRSFVDSVPASGAVIVRENTLNHERIEVYLRSIAGEIPEIEPPDEETIYGYRYSLFGSRPEGMNEALWRRRYTQSVVRLLDRLKQLQIRKTAESPGWERRVAVYDPWLGELDIFCTPGEWPEIKKFIEQYPPQNSPGELESVFAARNAAYHYHRAVSHLRQLETEGHIPGADLLSLWKKKEIEPKEWRAQLAPFEPVLGSARTGFLMPDIEMMPIVPHSPDSPTPLPRGGMMTVARLLAAEARVLEARGARQKALDSALAIVRMGWDWNQGPIAYRLLSADLVDLGSRVLARLMQDGSLERSRYQTIYQHLQPITAEENPRDFDLFLADVQVYEPEWFFPTSDILRQSLREGAEKAFIRRRAAYCQTEVLKIEAAVRLFQLDQGQFPENLQMLVPAYLDKVSLDPFTGKNLLYERSGENPRIYSFGPDGEDNFGRLIYDPTNGTVSDGDVGF